MHKSQSSVTIPQHMLKDYIPYEKLVVVKKSDGEAHILGKGAFGIVYKAVLDGKEVAVKEISAESINQKELEAFIEEARLMKDIPQHPNVLQFIGISPKPFCIITEFMEKGDLWSYLTCGAKISFKQQLDWIKGISKGMVHLSSRSIVHRDLAARNVLLRNSLQAVVSDFGLSRLGNEANVVYSKSEVGPLKWMAIESIQRKKYSEKSDVWAFGVTCSEILTREEPYGELDSVQAATLVVTEGLRSRLPENIPDALRQLIYTCWHAQPESRPTFASLSYSLDSINA